MNCGGPRWIVTSPLRLACAAGLSLAACGGAAVTQAPQRADVGPANDARSPGPVRFSERIAPLAGKRCDDCHAKAPGGPMAVYRNARSFVTPGKPEESPYYALPKGHPPAWGGDADLVRAWIASGALE